MWYHFLTITIIIQLLTILAGCLPAPSDRAAYTRESSASKTPTPVPSPTIFIDDEHISVQEIPFLQLGATQSTSSLLLASNFQDVINLRGKQLHRFLRIASNRTLTLCAVSAFASIAEKKIVVLPASINFIYSTSENTKEYFYQIESLESNLNQTKCNIETLTRALTRDFSGYATVYALKDVYPAGTGTTTSGPLKLYKTDGTELTDVSVEHLSFMIKGEKDSEDTGSPYCANDKECTLLGDYNCCLPNVGQCVKDRAVKSKVDQTSEAFKAALAIIKLNPSAFKDYPEFFYICPTEVQATPTPVATPYVENDFIRKRELYDCSVPQEGEMSLCTITYKNAKEQIASPTPTPFATEKDDRNFKTTYMGSTSLLPSSSITEITYGGEVLYNLKKGITSPDVTFLNTSYNDTLSDAQKITVKATLAEGTSNDYLKIRYRIDGSCIPINTTLFRCNKYFIQGQEDTDDLKITDHNPSSNLNRQYYLPYYANLDYEIVFKVDDMTTQEGVHWERVHDSLHPYIELIPYDAEEQKGLDINDNQKVEITYYSTLASVMQSKLQALNEISDRCHCNSINNCYLRPIKQDEKIIDYECDYPQEVSDALPIQKDVSTQTIPLRFYDSSGVSYEAPKYGVATQEGKVFSYTSKKKVKPSNTDIDPETNQMVSIGFNEIYGSMKLNDDKAAKPPVVVKVKANQQYDIRMHQVIGQFTPCEGCGMDYYKPTISKFFPESSQYKGGGYTPSKRTKRSTTETHLEGEYRADDLLFGRACFVPATMIPWSHQKKSSVAEQRRKRLMAQHFLFTNGYQRDWYGFDYGSLIGSFDGVTWFSVGNSRRVKSTSNRLFLAINAYFADLTINNNYQVVISKVESDIGTVNSGDSNAEGSELDVTTDFDSDGAECQKNHLCETDSDCITQLGWDYTCQTIADIRTDWPVFDENGVEKSDSSRNVRLIDIIVGGLGKPDTAKRCVYRGRGSPCLTDYDTTNKDISYAKTVTPGINACLANNYCQTFLDSKGVPAPLFNLRIARYGVPPATQNDPKNDVFEGTDEFGLGARVIGRPLRYHGEEKIDSEVRDQLNANRIYSLCLPGKDPTDGEETYISNHKKKPTNDYAGDRVLGIGMSNDNGTDFHDYALNSCPVLNTKGNYISLDRKFYTNKLSSALFKNLSGTQNISTNLLKVFTNSGEANLLSSPTDTLNEQLLEENRCLRAPGSPCFTDLDCAPSSFISEQVKALGMSTNQTYNNYEYQFWVENMVCGQLFPVTSSEHNLKKNRCCRISGETITLGTKYDETNEDLGPLSSNAIDIETEKLATIDMASNSNTRYSRLTPAYYDMKTTPALDSSIKQIPALIAPERNQGKDDFNNGNDTPSHGTLTIQNRPQFSTIDKILSQTCCGGGWVRNFNTDGNGGGHQWGPSKAQEIPKDSFKCLAFTPRTDGLGSKKFMCADANFDCHAKNLDANEGKQFSDFLSSLELLGIPQVLIKSSDHSMPSSERVACYTYVDPIHPTEYDDDTIDAQNLVYQGTNTQAPDQPIPGTVRYVSTTAESESDPNWMWGIPEFKGNLQGVVVPFYSASDPKNFDQTKGLKMIFSSDTFSCCYPAGQAYNFEVTAKQCCTGNISQDNNNQIRCCLPDYTNVSIYLNRYVSSEASQLDSSLFDPHTGTLSPQIVQQIATDKQLCCSGQMARGRAIEQNPVPGTQEDQGKQMRTRFLYMSSDPYADYYNKKQRWNTNIYCVPSGGK